MTHALRAFVVVCMAALVVACSDSTNPAPPFAFNRPEHLAFVCVDPEGDDGDPDSGGGTQGDKDPEADGKAPAQTPRRPLVLPMRCCARSPALAPADSEVTRSCPVEGAEPTLHALVSQSTRGEVAAVDLVNGEVLDSDVIVPGFTFVDVGGLPSAIVVPEMRPMQPEGTYPEGPPWTYVASAESQSVRAVATCRFRAGNGCGPEREDVNSDLEARTQVPLPSSPRDMVLGPDGALWVTLPDLGLLARIPLSAEWGDPFAMTEDGARPREPHFFSMPVVGDSTRADPALEDPAYGLVCGLGYGGSLQELRLPDAPPAPSTGGSRPTRLRYDSVGEMLLVADAARPVIHAFAISEDGEPTSRGHLSTGAHVRDFAVTAPVPETVDEELSPDAPLKRYVYAIDERDGSLMAFAYDFDIDTGLVTAKPLVSPTSPINQRYRDRLDLGGAIATALDVIDTRGLSAERCVDAPVDALEAQVDELESRLKRLERSNAADPSSTLDRMIAETREALSKAEARLAIRENAGPNQLRGVFVAVSTLDGFVRIIDVYDLDVECRAAAYCSGNDLLEVDDAAPVVVRRHAPRLFVLDDRDVAVSSDVHFAPTTCPEGYHTEVARSRVDDAPEANAPDTGEDEAPGAGNGGTTDPQPAQGDALVCGPNDPWRAVAQTWVASWEGIIPQLSFSNGYLRDIGGGRIELVGPPGLDLCARGVVEQGTELLEGVMVAGDRVAIVGDPPDTAPADCPDANPDAPVELTVVEAYADRLVLEPVGREAAGTARDLLRCYPDFVSVATHVTDQFAVLGVPNLYLHRMIADESGRCIVDQGKDPRLIGRAFPNVEFVNPFVAFTLPSSSANDALTPSVELGAFAQRVQSTVFDSSLDTPDALPATVMYFPYTSDLFVVDSASQGLRRFLLSPFGPTITSFR